MDEFELIRRYFQPISESTDSEALVLGMGDDCAIQRLPAGNDLVFSIDTMVEGVHFPRKYSAEYLAWRSLGAAASDLAAMGAAPVCFTLALTLPAADSRWLESFARGLSDAGKSFGLTLAGGDTTRGPLTVTIQVHGVIKRGREIRRSGACDGDLICVSGTLGDAGAALDYLNEPQPTGDVASVLAHYHRPVPRLALGQSLVPYASSGIDISDGLIADLGHILEKSGVGASINAASLPLSPALRALKGPAAARYALCSGDDYELCVTVPPEGWQALPDPVKRQLTVVGTVEAKAGLRLLGEHATELNGSAGFKHFGGEHESGG